MIAQDINEVRRQLAVEIFDLTGQKMDLDDPAVTAALFYSAKLRQSADAACQSMVACAVEAAKAAASSATIDKQKKLQGQLTSYVEGLKRKLKTSVETSAMRAVEENTPSISQKQVYGIVVSLIVFAALGFVLGAKSVNVPDLSEKQIRDLHFGSAMWNVWPDLGRDTQVKITRALEAAQKKQK